MDGMFQVAQVSFGMSQELWEGSVAPNVSPTWSGATQTVSSGKTQDPK